MRNKVVLKTQSELSWNFDSSEPSAVLNEHGGFVSHERVDPFPAYAHDKQVVKRCVNEVTDAFPISWPVTFYILSNEGTSRTNAHACGEVFNYDRKLKKPALNGEEYARVPYIVFSGKRIPIMPAMTRYLVAHEYGHIVEDWIAWKRGIKDNELINEYAKMRGLSFPNSYGGCWHLTPGEVFANDFRVLICRSETEFWPHPIRRPEVVPKVITWWNRALHKYAAR